MGVEYEHWILPRDRDHAPSAETFALLVEALREERWIVSDGAHACRALEDRSPGCKKRQREGIPEQVTAEWVTSKLDTSSARAIDRELVLFFPVDVDDTFETWAEADVRFPFTVGADETSNYHEYQIFLADDFTAWTNGGFTETVSGACDCGAELEYDVLTEYPETLAAHDARRIRRSCPSCGARFDPGARSVAFQHGDGAAEEQLRGGLTFRFAIRIDCHKGWPRSSARLALAPELLALVSRVLGTAVEDVGAFY